MLSDNDFFDLLLKIRNEEIQLYVAKNASIDYLRQHYKLMKKYPKNFNITLAELKTDKYLHITKITRSESWIDAINPEILILKENYFKSNGLFEYSMARRGTYKQIKQYKIKYSLTEILYNPYLTNAEKYKLVRHMYKK